MAAPRPRIAVTGLGICTSIGKNVEEFRRHLFAGASGLKPIETFDPSDYRTDRACLIDEAAYEGLDAADAFDRASRIALAATREALADAKLEITPELRYRTAVSVASSLGGMLEHENNMRRHPGCANGDGPDALYDHVLQIPPCQLGAYLARACDVRGGHFTVVTACSAGSNALAIAADLLRNGRAEVVITNGTEPFSMLAFAGFNILMALTRDTSRPFDKNRDGLIIGEGAGTLILERWEHAEARGARIYAELAGYGLSNDAFHPTQPDPQAGGAYRAVQRAFVDAGVAAEDMDYVNAHGTATRHNDAMELKAISRVYGELARRVPVSSIKSAIGHTLGAAGTIEAIATVLALHHRFLPPTPNWTTPEVGYEYDFVPTGRPAPELEVASSHSFGFGGNSACLIFRQPDEAREATA
ncbi:MAG: beta-ketoacyl-[acyl-carrier-protein] synthase family protein [Thermoanaerobaculia bacterium]|nr:beta-ketoacyl-[acyl-carrier-protein] synthase family protein [Thermoanaerobaculia bacterium]